MNRPYSRKLQIQKAFMARYLHDDITDISVSDICSDIGLSRTSFYHYYSDIFNVLEETEDEIIDHLSDLNREFYTIDMHSDTDMIYKKMLPTLSYIKENANYFKAFLRHRDTDNFHIRWAGIIKADWLKRYNAGGRSVSNIDVILTLTAAAIIGLYEHWFYHLDEFSEREIFDGIYEVLASIF